MTKRATQFASTSRAAITPPPRPHVDDIAVDALAAQQKARLAEKRDQGFNGWDDPRRCSVEKLSMLMAQSMCKGKVVDVANFAAMLHSRAAAPELVGEHAMRSLLRGAREHRASVASQLRAIIADDSYAFTFQTMAQYRTALLKTFDAVATTEEPTPQACAHCGGSGRQEDVFEQASAARCHINLEGLAAKLLAPRVIVRDEEGYLVHPDLPAADEGTRYDLLLGAFGLETAFVSMETDCKDEALLDRYFEDGDSDCSGWTPTPPAGEGWALLEIYPTEDGPYAMFARRKPAQRPLTRRQRRDAERQARQERESIVYQLGEELVRAQAPDADPRAVDTLIEALDCTLREHGYTVAPAEAEQPTGEACGADGELRRLLVAAREVIVQCATVADPDTANAFIAQIDAALAASKEA